MINHTPGPWAADAIAENGDVRVACVDMPLVIASVHNGASLGELVNDLPPRTQWANAYLIAAAPDLLAALDRLSETLAPWLVTADAGLPAVIKTLGDCADLHNAQRAARDVIAKAKAP